MTNICTNCGKNRVASKTWSETIELYGRKQKVTYSDFVCPDPECQKIVEKQLSDQKEKRAQVERNKEQEKIAREKRTKAAKAEAISRLKSI